MMAFSSLYQQSYQRLGLIISLTGMVIFIILLLLDFNYMENWEQKIFIMNHYIIILGLIILTYSREKVEDERTQNFRHRLLRISYLLNIVGIIGYAAISILDRVEFNISVIFYIIETALILYQVLFRVSLRTNPSWIFRETPRNRSRSIIPVAALVFLIGWLIYVVITFKI